MVRRSGPSGQSSSDLMQHAQPPEAAQPGITADANDLSELEHLRDELAAASSLRVPLATILGLARLLQGAGLSAATAAEGTPGEEAERLLRLAGDLLLITSAGEPAAAHFDPSEAQGLVDRALEAAAAHEPGSLAARGVLVRLNIGDLAAVLRALLSTAAPADARAQAVTSTSDDVHARFQAAFDHRPPGRPAERGILTAGPIRLDLGRREATVGKARVQLPPMEFAFLALMVKNRERVLPEPEIRELLSGGRAAVPRQSVKVTVYRLRGHLTAAGADPAIIESVRGHGYRLRVFSP
jgi:two-component system, OmpR family, response regulator RegX3